MDKKVYILMATYNGEKYLKEQIDSILNQTYKNWRLIIHDDNSTDNTLNLIKEYVEKYPEKIILIDDDISTGGAKENFAYLLNKIDDNFDYIMFSDQDDVWFENKIELTLNKMIETERKYSKKPILVHTDLKVVDENLNVIAESMIRYQKIDINNQKYIKFLALENVVTGCTVMINKYLYNLVLNIPKEAIMHDWWIALVALKNNGIIEFLNIPTILYRQHTNNDTGAKRIDKKYYFKKLLCIKEIIRGYNRLIKQTKKISINLSIIEIIFLKFYLIKRKIR